MKVRLVALDLDGVVYRGGVLLPGVSEALREVLARGLDVRYVSNNSTAHRRTVAERLLRMGVPAGEDKVLTSGYATGRWLRARLQAGAPVMVVGEAGLLEELREAGFAVFHAGDAGAPSGLHKPAAVVVGMDRGFCFDTLSAAQQTIREGALFLATNPDATFPTSSGLIPGAGAVVAAVATAAQAEPVLIGKPSSVMAGVLAEESGIAPAETIFVGDRVSTDIVMGHAAGMTTVLVLTGVTQGTDPRISLADFVIRDLTELPGILDELAGSGEKL
ncbi:MAG: HAD-IIA family hydrolase [Actinobacteria bacterium]|nr:HAD-IIA family hydrolase [Actinomycetota bacterium]